MDDSRVMFDNLYIVHSICESSQLVCSLHLSTSPTHSGPSKLRILLNVFEQTNPMWQKSWLKQSTKTSSQLRRSFLYQTFFRRSRWDFSFDLRMPGSPSPTTCNRGLSNVWRCQCWYTEAHPYPAGSESGSTGSPDPLELDPVRRTSAFAHVRTHLDQNHQTVDWTASVSARKTIQNPQPQFRAKFTVYFSR